MIKEEDFFNLTSLIDNKIQSSLICINQEFESILYKYENLVGQLIHNFGSKGPIDQTLSFLERNIYEK